MQRAVRVVEKKLKRDKDRCNDCRRRGVKCTPLEYNFPGGEKCDQCRLGGYCCSVRRNKRDYEAWMDEQDQVRVPAGQAAAGPTSTSNNRTGYGYQRAAVQSPAGPLSTPQREPSAASQSGTAFQVENNQYELSANVQQVPIEVRPSSAVPAEYISPNSRPPDYRQLDEEHTRVNDWYVIARTFPYSHPLML